MRRSRQRSRFGSLASLVAAMALAAAACGATANGQQGSAADGPAAAESAVDGSEVETAEPAEPILSGQFETISGDSINLADFDGQDVVLWFWAPW